MQVVIIDPSTKESCSNYNLGKDIVILHGVDDFVCASAAAAGSSLRAGTIDEAYRLTAGPAGCTIRAGGARGALWGLRTLTQLLFPVPASTSWYSQCLFSLSENSQVGTGIRSAQGMRSTARKFMNMEVYTGSHDGESLACETAPTSQLPYDCSEETGLYGDNEIISKLTSGVDVADWPEFSWRGCLLDCARHFMPVAYIAKHLEALSRFKMNVLHWHLTDDQVVSYKFERSQRIIFFLPKLILVSTNCLL